MIGLAKIASQKMFCYQKLAGLKRCKFDEEKQEFLLGQKIAFRFSAPGGARIDLLILSF